MNVLTDIKKITIILLVVFVITFSLSAPYSSHNIDKLAYVVALGIDVGKNDNLELTVQLSKPESGSSSAGASYSNIEYGTECSTIESGISILNNYISRRINLSHCKILVLSETLAANGVSDYIYTLLNNVHMSPHASVIISKTSSSDFLKSAKQELENLPAKYYEVSSVSSQYTGYTQNVSLIKFFSDYNDSFTECFATLGSIGDSPITTPNSIEEMGLAVFRGDKLVGELSPQESIWHLMVCGKLKSCIVNVPNPLGDTDSIDIKLQLRKNPKRSVTFVNGTPQIDCKITANIKIVSATKQSTSAGIHYYSKEHVKLIEDTCNQYLQSNINNYLYKTAKSLHSDIDSFGRHAVKYFITTQDWQAYNWLDNYKNSSFNVDVQTTLKSDNTFL